MISSAVRDDSTGLYTFQENGSDRIVPSVSSVLAPLVDYSGVPPEKLEWAQERGKAVHKATELYDLGTLDHTSIHPLIQRFLGSWLQFRRDTGFEPLFIEAFVRSKLGYAGRLDRIGYLPIGPRWPECHLVLDIKTGAELPISLGPQVAAYREAAIETYRDHQLWEPKLPLLRGVVTFDEERDYDFRFLEDPMDWEIFKSCLNIYHYKRRKK